MTESQVLEVLNKFAELHRCTIEGPEDNIVELTFNFETDRRCLVKYEITPGQSAYLTFKYLVGQLLDKNACLNLFFIGRWETTSYYFRGKEIKGTQYLFAETRVYLHEDLSVEQATHTVVQHARLPMFELDWPKGVDIF